MKRSVVLLLALSLAVLPAGAFGFKWKSVPVDASRTGVTCPSADNVPEAMGRMEGRRYVAPNGRVFKGRSATAKVAKLMLDAQPGMATVKEVVGYCPTGLERGGDESLLGDWTVDILMAAAEKEFGRKVDIGVMNHGGIRIDMPQGEVLMDDLMSMFPFKNYLAMVTMKGTEVKALFERSSVDAEDRLVLARKCIAEAVLQYAAGADDVGILAVVLDDPYELLPHAVRKDPALELFREFLRHHALRHGHAVADEQKRIFRLGRANAGHAQPRRQNADAIFHGRQLYHKHFTLGSGLTTGPTH